MYVLTISIIIGIIYNQIQIQNPLTERKKTIDGIIKRYAAPDNKDQKFKIIDRLF
jgi:hypothetical protein